MILKLLLSASIFLNAILAVLLMDSAISLDGSRMEQEALKRRVSVALLMLNKGFLGQRSDKVLASFDKAALDELLVKREGEEILVGDLAFRLKDDIIVSVRYFDD